MTTEYKFEGWLGLDPDSADGKMQWSSFEPKTWQEDDVDIQITHCGVCGTDLHTLRSGWGPTPYPCCVGHEIVGKAVRVGNNVKHVKVGDRVGVGALARTCFQPDCPDCSAGRENHCLRAVNTYGSVYPNGEGKSYGGYADYNRTNGRFVFPIPEKLSSADAAPLLCAGVTVYSPLKRNGCGPGKSVGIIGIGGLGHLGIMFAKALGADKVVAISRKASKKDEALALGADQYIATDDDVDWSKANRRSLDLIISTASTSDMPLQQYLEIVAAGGTYIQIGDPDAGALPPINALTLIFNGIKVGGSLVGSIQDVEEMLLLAAEKGIKPLIQTRSLKDANQVLVDFNEGKARYRYVLVNEKHRDIGPLV